MASLSVLRRPLYLGLVLGLAVLLSGLYYAFSLRSAGMHTTVLTTTLATPEFGIKTFGPTYWYANVALDVLTAILTAVLITLTVASYRARPGALPGPVGSTASLAVAVATFG
jgi:hypothetical protein